jgi:peptidoglycan/xylan/chitin deacetylase (PgdA/CDA1 family)
VYKTYQSLYYAVSKRDPAQFLDLLPNRRPFWQFRDIMALEDSLGVRSAFYFLNEQHLFRDKSVTSWLRPANWRLFVGRYSPDSSDIAEIIRELDGRGWEIGLHGSYESYRDRDLLAEEKATLENVLGHSVLGGRQHYLNLERPETWEHHAAVGLSYDSTLGSATEYGFSHGYDPIRPFDDEFVVFPLTLMEWTLPDVESDPEHAWSECVRLLEEARDNGAVMTVLWHPTFFNERDFPNFGTIYRRLIERALEMGAWVGPPAELYQSLEGRLSVTRSSSALSDATQPRAGFDSHRRGGRG